MASKRRAEDEEDGVRYQPDDRPPILLTATIGLQLAALILVGAAVIPAVVFRSAGASDPVLAWAVFASLVLCGLTTMVQASPRFAAGYVIVTVARSAAIAVCIAAVSQGGPALLALLVGVTAVIQLLLAVRLSLFRRILTPAIAGTVIMLIPVSVVPVVLDNLERNSGGRLSRRRRSRCTGHGACDDACRTERQCRDTPLGTDYRSRSRSSLRRASGSLRAGPRRRSSMVRAPPGRAADAASRLRTGILGFAARVCDRHTDRNRPERKRQRRRPARILASAAGRGLPFGPEHGRRGGREQHPVRAGWHDAEHVQIFRRHLRGADRNGGAPSRHRHRGMALRVRLPAQGVGLDAVDSGSGHCRLCRGHDDDALHGRHKARHPGRPRPTARA